MKKLLFFLITISIFSCKKNEEIKPQVLSKISIQVEQAPTIKDNWFFIRQVSIGFNFILNILDTTSNILTGNSKWIFTDSTQIITNNNDSFIESNPVIYRNDSIIIIRSIGISALKAKYDFAKKEYRLYQSAGNSTDTLICYLRK